MLMTRLATDQSETQAQLLVDLALDSSQVENPVAPVVALLLPVLLLLLLLLLLRALQKHHHGRLSDAVGLGVDGDRDADEDEDHEGIEAVEEVGLPGGPGQRLAANGEHVEGDGGLDGVVERGRVPAEAAAHAERAREEREGEVGGEGDVDVALLVGRQAEAVAVEHLEAVALALGALNVDTTHVHRRQARVLDLELAADCEQRLGVAALLRLARCN